jgi:hypothetical protein
MPRPAVHHLPNGVGVDAAGTPVARTMTVLGTTFRTTTHRRYLLVQASGRSGVQPRVTILAHTDDLERARAAADEHTFELSTRVTSRTVVVDTLSGETVYQGEEQA